MTTLPSSPRSWRLDLPYEKPPLSANDRDHHMAVWRKKRNLSDQVRALARHHRIPRLERIHVELHYLPARRGVRDNDNLVATLKPAIDGLRDYPAKYDDTRLVRAAWTGVVADDDPTHVTWTPPVIHDPEPGQRLQRVWLVITEGATE